MILVSLLCVLLTCENYFSSCWIPRCPEADDWNHFILCLSVSPRTHKLWLASLASLLLGSSDLPFTTTAMRVCSGFWDLNSRLIACMARALATKSFLYLTAEFFYFIRLAAACMFEYVWMYVECFRKYFSMVLTMILVLIFIKQVLIPKEHNWWVYSDQWPHVNE